MIAHGPGWEGRRRTRRNGWPNDQRIGVGDGRFAKAEVGANLSTESFCSTRCQQLTITCRGRRVELLAQRPAAAAEENQQHSEAEPRATVLGHRQGVVLGRQGPRFVRGPDTAGHAELAPEDGAISIRASVSINVVRLTPKLRHTAAFDIPSSSAARMASSFSPTIIGGRPPTRPRRLCCKNRPESVNCLRWLERGVAA